MHNIIPAVIEASVAEWAEGDFDIRFEREVDPIDFSARHRLYVAGVKTESYIPGDIAYDIDYGMRMSGKPLSGEELYHEVHTIVNNVICNEVHPVIPA
jgi:hypothetical protein